MGNATVFVAIDKLLLFQPHIGNETTDEMAFFFICYFSHSACMRLRAAAAATHSISAFWHGARTTEFSVHSRNRRRRKITLNDTCVHCVEIIKPTKVRQNQPKTDAARGGVDKGIY